MPDDLTLPGEIPGLLRKCTPVRRLSDGWLGRVWSVHPDKGKARVCWSLTPTTVENTTGLVVPLHSETGRAHAAWWAMRAGPTKNWTAADVFAVACAKDGDPMTDDQIRTLRDLVLRLWTGGDRG